MGISPAFSKDRRCRRKSRYSSGLVIYSPFMAIKRYEEEFAGKPLKIEIGRLANLANGSVYVQYGNTAVLVTAVMSSGGRANIDYMPLSVDYEERYYAAGKIKGSKWIKREGRPSDEAIL